MENIITCVRIRPLLQDQTEEVICQKYQEKSVINLKTQERYDFGNIFTQMIVKKFRTCF